MSKVFLMCGRICSGKSTYARKLREEHKAVILSVDEITLALFGRDVGEKHDSYVEKAEEYLYGKALEILESGINVVLDWGFWTRQERDYARDLFGSRGIEYEFFYPEISPEEWKRRVQKRDREILEGRLEAYYVDEGLMAKFEGIFEPPEPDEEITFIPQPGSPLKE